MQAVGMRYLPSLFSPTSTSTSTSLQFSHSELPSGFGSLGIGGTMEVNNNADSPHPPREREIENAHKVSYESSEAFFVVGQRLLSTSSISLSIEDLRNLELDVDTQEEHAKEEESVRTVSEDQDEAENKAESSMDGASDTELKENGKMDSQLKGFLRKLKKGPTVPFHPTLPHLPSIKKLSKKRAERGAHGLPLLPPHLEVDLYSCFQNTWINFSLAELEEITNNFSHGNLIGEGGYSEVYKGHLEDGQLVAVKRLIRGTTEEMTADYLSELGILVHVNHPNIASVIGYGVEGGMHLVLPLSVNGSLSCLLKGRKEKLTWKLRYDIAIGIASGLAYLHEGCQRRIIHRDIKSANILLTEDFEPKISDFGLAKWLPDQWTHITVSQFEGTFGYLPPEFFMHGMVDEKTDVYAYGVLLLELISSRPAIDEANNSIVMWAKPKLLSKNITELLDPALENNFDCDQLNGMVLVASLCIHQDSTERPLMCQVLRMLKGDEGILQSKKKFQKRPALKRTYPLEAITEQKGT